MELVGGRVVLRPKRLEDAWLDYVWRSDEELAQLDGTHPIRMKFEEFLRLLKDQLRYPTPGSGRFGIDTREGRYIGNCMYYDVDTTKKEAEVGIVIGDRDYWSNGYGSDALITMLDYLFADTYMQRLYLHTLEWNRRAQRAFQKCGFSPVTPVRRSGLNFLLMDLNKDRWLEILEDRLAARDAAAQASKE